MIFSEFFGIPLDVWHEKLIAIEFLETADIAPGNTSLEGVPGAEELLARLREIPRSWAKEICIECLSVKSSDAIAR